MVRREEHGLARSRDPHPAGAQVQFLDDLRPVPERWHERASRIDPENPAPGGKQRLRSRVRLPHDSLADRAARADAADVQPAASSTQTAAAQGAICTVRA